MMAGMVQTWPMSNTPKSLFPVAAEVDNAFQTLGRALAQSDPRAVVMRTFAAPFETDVKLDIATLPAGSVQRKKTAAGERVEIDLGAVGGTAIVNKVTPEQLLAVVAAIIATSKDSTTACQRIRAEVAGWKFQAADGSIG